MKPTLLIDADLIVYRIASVNEKHFDFGGQDAISYDEDGAINDIEDFVTKLGEKFNPEKVIMCFTSSDNFRYDVLPTYKSNRKDKEKPKLFGVLKDYLESEYPCWQFPKLEADDIMGIYSSSDPGKYIVCSGDKDMKTIPCKFYNFLNDTVEEIDLDEANYWFFYQTLIGDTTDGYKGCPLIGPKKAETFLNNLYADVKHTSPGFDSESYIWQSIVELYEKTSEKQAMKAYGVYPLTEEIALQQARVARILRYGEYDFETKEVKLWTP